MKETLKRGKYLVLLTKGLLLLVISEFQGYELYSPGQFRAIAGNSVSALYLVP
jgi:hypothetical protein